MPARRSLNASFSAERFVQAITNNQAELYERFERKIEDVIERVEHVKTTLQQDIRFVQQDVRLEGQERQLLAQEISQVQLQLGDLRDAVHIQKQREAQQAAERAVSVAAPVMAQQSARATAQRLRWPQWIAVVGVIFMVLATFAEKAPQTMRFMESTWKTWAGIKER